MSDDSFCNSESTSRFFNFDDDCSETSQSTESENETTEYYNLNRAENLCPITPFNMTEELKEGYFDSEGMYHWKKKPKPNDYWLDSTSNYNFHKSKEIHNDLASKVDKVDLMKICDCGDLYKKILSYLNPEETIAQALCRLGEEKPLPTIERLKLKRLGMLKNSNNTQKIIDLTELVNTVLTRTGDFDIYQKTYNDIRKCIENNNIERNDAGCLTHKTELDMFADDFIKN